MTTDTDAGTNAGTTTATSAGSNNISPAVWGAGGAFALVAAAMVGAMVMKSNIDSPSPAGVINASQMAVPVAPVAPNGPGGNVAYQTKRPEVSRAAAQEQRFERNEASRADASRAAAQDQRYARTEAPRAAVCSTCGVVESVTPIETKAEGSGLGAVAGGVLGGVLGNQMGGGKGKTAMTVVGAIGGGLAGNEVERRTRGTTTYDVQIRLDDGSRRVVRQAQEMAVGTHVQVEGDHLRVGN